jgi:hypothetical protein
MKATHIATAAATAAILVGGYLAVRPKPALKPDGVRVQGIITREVLRGGKVVESESVNKTLVASGIRLMLGLIIGDSSNKVDTAAYICVGNDSTATDTSMTELAGDSLEWGNVDSITRSANNASWWYSYLSAKGNFTWREIGLFCDSASTMIDRASVSFGKKGTSDTWRIRVKLQWQ